MIYLLEDDENIRNFVLYALNNSGFQAKGFALPSEQYAALRQEIPSLLLLDVMLPEEDGLQVLQKLRAKKETAFLPVIMLTAKDTEFDKVTGLETGADDYVAKPFGTMELIARIKALLRRTDQKKEKTEYTAGGLFVSPSKYIVRASGRDVTLTYKEFELLCLLIKNQDTVFTRDRILQEIWGYAFDGENRTVDVHIRTLRAKLGDCGELIQTVRGIGYKLSADIPTQVQ